MKKLRDILPIFVVLVGLLVLLYPTISNFLVQQRAEQAVSNYEGIVESMSEEEYAAILATAQEYNEKVASLSGLSEEDGGSGTAVSSADLLEEYWDILDVDGTGMMGYITIPKLDETLPIYHGTEEAVLQVGTGHIETTSLPISGTSVHAAISGHRGLPSAKLFTDLDQMETGDVFYIRILKETYAYEVDQILTVLPTETEALAIEAGEEYVTLVTCTPYGINSHRLLVRAHAIPYTEDMEDAVGDTGSFINIPLPYLLLMIAVAVLAVFLIALKWRQHKLAAAAEAAAVAAAPLGAHGRMGDGTRSVSPASRASTGTPRRGKGSHGGGRHAK